MSSDNRTPRLHSFRIACAIASATLCATAIAQVAFSLKPAIEVLDNPVIADSPAYPALAISTLVPAVIGIATTILSAVLVRTIKSGDPFKKGRCSAFSSLFKLPPASTPAHSKPPFRCLAARGPSAPKRSLHHSIGPLWFSASSCSCFPSSSCTPESCTSTPTRLRKETPCP